MSHEAVSRREFVAGAAVVGATIVLSGDVSAAAGGAKTFTILHTNDMHSTFIGMGPAVVIALSHGGVEKDKDRRYSAGEDVGLAEAVPGIDVVIGGHSHTELQDAIIVNGRTPAVMPQTFDKEE